MSLFSELKRRNVFRVAIAYTVIAWILAQVADLAFDNFGTPEWVSKTVLFLLVLGFPLAIFFAWAFELTPEGLKKEKDVDRAASITSHTGRKLDYSIIVLLVLALGYFVWESRVADRGLEVDQATVEVAAATIADAVIENDKSIAVLPFENRSSREEDEFFTEGIHDDLLTTIAKIGSMKVISRTSVMTYKDTTKNIREIAKELGVAHILEGGVQRSGNKVRINIHRIQTRFIIDDTVIITVEPDGLRISPDNGHLTSLRRCGGGTQQFENHEPVFCSRHPRKRAVSDRCNLGLALVVSYGETRVRLSIPSLIAIPYIEYKPASS